MIGLTGEPLQTLDTDFSVDMAGLMVQSLQTLITLHCL